MFFDDCRAHRNNFAKAKLYNKKTAVTALTAHTCEQHKPLYISVTGPMKTFMQNTVRDILLRHVQQSTNQFL